MSTPARPILVMGVSGAGKSTLARAVAETLGGTFIEGDDYHSAESRAKMAVGVPLADADRWPWLAAVGAAATKAVGEGRIAVVACSALKRSYRDALRGALGDIALVHLDGDPALIRRRMAARDHFMPASLLDSQLAILEAPTKEESALRVDAARPLDESVAAIAAWYAGGPAPS